MRLLLDSQALLWTLQDNSKVSTAVRSAASDAAARVFVSPLSFYELMFKAKRGRQSTFALKIPEAAHSAGLTELPLTTQHLIHAALLDWAYGDPFDRMLLAQATLEDMRLISADAKFDEVTDRRVW